MIKIVQDGNPILRKIAKEVPIKEIGSIKIRKILEDMREALNSQEDGVALAAPQIGISLCIFIISENALAISRKKVEGEEIISPKETTKLEKHLVFINPKIIKKSRERKKMEEGCLSVRPLYGKVSRSIKATVQAYDEHGKLFTRGASGLIAQAFQHECDHLDGVLFIDKATEVREMVKKT